MDIKTTFVGLEIKSPIIVGSSGLTSEVSKLKELEKAGAGAIVLKSIFEEQILNETSNNMRNKEFFAFSDSYDYIAQYSQSNAVNKYIELITEAKQTLTIPVVASINCVSNSEWLNFALKMQQAGADAIELNMFILPSDVNLASEDVERFYEETIQIIRRAVTIPISIKISSYFTALARFVQKISLMGVANLNIFNRFCLTDIDIDTMTTNPAHIMTNQDDVYDTIRWTAILSKFAKCPLTAGGGVHKEADVVKLLLAGANNVQIVSALYSKGFDFITKSNEFLIEWGEKHNFNAISNFRGKMAMESNQPSAFLRVQFMKYFAGIK
jgi:dihydroorotate dehydrogenase (fumarate)